MRDAIREYLTTAGDQIRWDRARPALLSELEDHLLSETEAAESAGLSQEEAQAEAVRQMGDPVMIGQELDRVHRPKPQWGLLGLTLAVAMAVTVLRVELTRDWWFQDGFFWGNDSGNCYLALYLGTALMVAGHFLDYTILARWGKALLPAGLGLGFLLQGSWETLHESLRYYGTQFYYLTMPLLFGGWLYAMRGSRWKGFLLSVASLPSMTFFAYYARFGNTQGPGPTLIMTGVCLLLLTVLTWADWFELGKIRGRCLSAGLSLAFAAAFLSFTALLSPARSFAASLHPELYADTYGYQATVVRQVLAGANWLGAADWVPSMVPTAQQIGLSDYWQIMPCAGNSFFLTTVLQSLGWIPYLLLAGGFVLLSLWLLVKGLRQKNALGKITSLAVALPLLLQTVFGVMTSLGFIWFAVPFPLVGGSCILTVQMGLVGLALSVFRQEALPAAAYRWRQQPVQPLRRDQFLPFY